MREISHRGIIFSVQPYQEKDALISILTQDEGKMQLLAKGLRAEKSHRTGILQPFSCLRFTRTIPKSPHGLSRLIHSEFEFTIPQGNHFVFAELSLLAEISKRFLKENHHISGIFELWENFLQIEFRKPREEICGFLIQFFTSIGFFPEFSHCSQCSQKFSEEKNIFWVQSEGIFCCTPLHINVTLAQNKKISFLQMKSLFFFQKAHPKNFSKLQLSGEEAKALMDIISQEITAFSEKPFLAQRIFEEIMERL